MTLFDRLYALLMCGFAATSAIGMAAFIGSEPYLFGTPPWVRWLSYAILVAITCRLIWRGVRFDAEEQST
jgi:membrane protein implicated in regulation of membrane protease activity